MAEDIAPPMPTAPNQPSVPVTMAAPEPPAKPPLGAQWYTWGPTTLWMLGGHYNVRT